jgi:hypothetical protein
VIPATCTASRARPLHPPEPAAGTCIAPWGRPRRCCGCHGRALQGYARFRALGAREIERQQTAWHVERWWQSGVTPSFFAGNEQEKALTPPFLAPPFRTLETVTYTVSTVKDQYGCLGQTLGHATITIKPPAPENVTATASSPASGAVNAVRRAAGLPNATFTGTIAAGGAVDATHVEELGIYLNQARSNLGFSPVSLMRYPLAGKLILAADLTALRGGVR